LDAGFAQVRPSPWRQAVDLGNMMLVLALRTDPAGSTAGRWPSSPRRAGRGVHRHPRGGQPAHLRGFLKRDPRDLLGQFRALAPPRHPIVLQRFEARRVITAAAMHGAAAVAVAVTAAAFRPAVN
jgi:hypothetical protein